MAQFNAHSFPGSQGYGNYDPNADSSFDASQAAYYGSHRASAPELMQRSLSQPDAMDLNVVENFARNQANALGVQDVIRPPNDLPWIHGLQPRNDPQGRSVPQLPSWPQHAYQPNTGGAMTEPLPNQNPAIYIDYSASRSTSETGDSGYMTQRNRGSSGVDRYVANQVGPGEDWSQPQLQPFSDFPESLSAHNTQAFRPFPHAAQSVVSENLLAVPDSGRGKRPPPPPCSFCDKPLKNASDAKKHELTHRKPFECGEPGCNRKQGFGTANDLQRHRKSVHSQHPLVGTAVGYICSDCPHPTGREKRKFWPRRDNFKAHIRRKHLRQEMNEQQKLQAEHRLFESSRTNMRPDDACTTFTGPTMDPSQADMDPYQSTFQSPISLSRNQSQHGAYGGNPFPDSAIDLPQTEHQLAGMGGMGMGMGMHTQEEYSSYPGMNSTSGLDALSSIATLHGSPGYQSHYAQPQLQPSKRQRLDGYSESYGGGSEHHQASSHWLLPSSNAALEGSSSAQQVTLTPAPAVEAAAEEGRYACPKCHKVRKRECDLKKHMKRHTRPYGCTFPDCTKKFGSRNDWKRHEVSQHYLLEMWKCGAARVDGGGGVCALKPFHNAAMLRRHLAGPRHRIQSEQELKRLCREFLLGRDGHFRFWCGFCDRLVEQVGGLPNAWEPRFKHIGDHVDKEGKEVARDWICIEHNKPKGMVTDEDRRRAKKAARVVKHSDEEGDGVLPDVGLSGERFSMGFQRGPGADENGGGLGKKRDHLSMDHDPFAFD